MTTAGSPNAGTTMPPPNAEPYKLRRAREGRMLAGIASGLATASGLDVAVVRICLGLSVLTGWGLGVLAYFLLWFVIPEEQPSRGRFVEPAPEGTARIIRYVLLGGALLMVLQTFGGFWPLADPGGHNDFGFDGLFGLVLLGIGAAVLLSRHRSGSDNWTSAPPAPPAATTTAATSTAPNAPFTPWTAPGVGQPVGSEDLDDLDRTDDTEAFGYAVSDETETLRYVAPDSFNDTTVVGAAAQTKRPGGAALGWARVVGWLALLWWVAGVLLMVGLWRFGAITITAPAVLFGASWVAFTVVLAALIRVRRPAVLLATLAALLVPFAIAQATAEPDGPSGTRTLRPLVAPEVSNYRQAIGHLELDFSQTRFAVSRPSLVNARVGTGGLTVTVPDNVSLTVVTRVEAGGYDVLGKRTTGGVGQRETLRFDGCEGAPHVQLRLRSGAGWTEVRRANGSATATCAAATPEQPR